MLGSSVVSCSLRWQICEKQKSYFSSSSSVYTNRFHFFFLQNPYPCLRKCYMYVYSRISSLVLNRWATNKNILWKIFAFVFEVDLIEFMEFLAYFIILFSFASKFRLHAAGINAKLSMELYGSNFVGFFFFLQKCFWDRSKQSVV